MSDPDPKSSLGRKIACVVILYLGVGFLFGTTLGVTELVAEQLSETGYPGEVMYVFGWMILAFVVLGLILVKFGARLWRRWPEAAGVVLMIATIVGFVILQKEAKRDLRPLMSAECVFGFIVGLALLGIGLVRNRNRRSDERESLPPAK